MNIRRPVCEILVGAPASGKSTYARNIVAQHPNTVIVSADDQRTIVGNTLDNYYDASNSTMATDYGLSVSSRRLVESVVWEQVHNDINNLLRNGKNVIVDNTNTNAFSRKVIRKIAFQVGAHVRQQFFDCDTETLIERNLTRVGSKCVPEHVIDRMQNSINKERQLIIDECAALNYTPTAMTGNTIVFDIDGTLANMGDRSPFADDLYYLDIPNTMVVGLCKQFVETGFNVLFWSGRKGTAIGREQTLAWLNKHVYNRPDLDSRLTMRADDDQRPDWIIKSEILRTFEQTHNQIPQLVVDDRQQVVDMWNNTGIQVWQVAQMMR